MFTGLGLEACDIVDAVELLSNALESMTHSHPVYRGNMAAHIYNEPTPDLPHPAAGMPRSSSSDRLSHDEPYSPRSEHTYPHEFGAPATCLSE